MNVDISSHVLVRVIHFHAIKLRHPRLQEMVSPIIIEKEFLIC